MIKRRFSIKTIEFVSNNFLRIRTSKCVRTSVKRTFECRKTYQNNDCIFFHRLKYRARNVFNIKVVLIRLKAVLLPKSLQKCTKMSQELERCHGSYLIKVIYVYLIVQLQFKTDSIMLMNHNYD